MQLITVAIASSPFLTTGRGAPAPAVPGVAVIEDIDGIVAQRFDARPGTFYLLRPDQHVCARWRQVDPAAVQQALERALCVAEVSTHRDAVNPTTVKSTTQVTA